MTAQVEPGFPFPKVAIGLVAALCNTLVTQTLGGVCMLRSIALVAVFFGLVAAVSLQGRAAEPAPQSASDTVESPRALLDRYCVGCHNDRTPTAGLNLQTVALDQVGHVPDEIGVWEKVVQKLRAGTMPPAGRRRPEPKAYDQLALWLEASLDAAAAANPNPGRPVIHRLNRAEYTNAVRDLLALAIDGRSMLPADDSGYGFDNIGDVLSISPSLLERYMIAAARISQLAVGNPDIRPTLQRYTVRPTLLQHERMSEEQPFGTRGGMSVRHYFPLDGEYRIKIRLQRTHANQIRGLGEPNDIEVRFDRHLIAEYTVGGDGPINPWAAVMSASAYEQTADHGLGLTLDVTAGTHTVGVAFRETRGLSEGVLAPRLSTASYEFAGDRDAPMSLDSVQIDGPYDASKPVDTPSRRRIFVCKPETGGTVADDEDCATAILSTLARRAFRRPVTDDDIDPLLGFYAEGRAVGGFDSGIERALRAVLVDPEFLFRIEREPDGVAPVTAFRVTDVELASRLSFFLWSSIPDDELLDLASRGELGDPDVLRGQVRRMLADAKSHALVENFAGQWLYLRNLRSVAPDPDAFPEFDENLREAFRRETELFVESQLREDRSVVELLTADYTFVNARLARHYDIPGVSGSHFRRVTFDDGRRGGLLGQGSILTATSYPNRTAPTLRGKWVLENLLGAPPPAPPPNVPELADSEAASPRSVRERLEAHRANPVCASCHAQMDPLGLALEPFDAIGKWRTHDGEAEIDASASLPDGSAFVGPAGVRAHLLGRRKRFVSAFTEKLLTYALGRGLEDYDPPAVRRIGQRAEREDYRWSSLVNGIVESVPFQMRRSREP